MQVLCFVWEWNAFAAIVAAQLKGSRSLASLGWVLLNRLEGEHMGRDGVSLG